MSNCNHGNCCNTCNNWNGWNNWNGRNGCSGCNNWNGRNGCSNCSGWYDWSNWGNSCYYRNSNSAYSRWLHPIHTRQAYYSCAGTQDGATLVIHKIALEAGCEQSCTPRTFYVRITGPSYPCGETFSLRAGNCLELDEPLVISGLEPGQYCIELLYDCPNSYSHTITGASCDGCVQVTNSAAPTVVTIVSRRNVCRRRSCGCSY